MAFKPYSYLVSNTNICSNKNWMFLLDYNLSKLAIVANI